jgi:membrane protein required for colicin V production
MHWSDILILSLIGISALISLLRGFVREAFSLLVWILAFWIAWTFFRDLSMRLDQLIATPSVRLGVAFVLLLLAALMVGGLINYLVIQLVQKTGLSGSDRFLGMIFGGARGVLVVVVLVLLAGLTPFPQDPWWQESRLIPYFEHLSVRLLALLPADVADWFRFPGEMPGAAEPAQI